MVSNKRSLEETLSTLSILFSLYKQGHEFKLWLDLCLYQSSGTPHCFCNIHYVRYIAIYFLLYSASCSLWLFGASTCSS